MFKYIIPGLLLINTIGINTIYEGTKILLSSYRYFYPDKKTEREIEILIQTEETNTKLLEELKLEIEELKRNN